MEFNELLTSSSSSSFVVPFGMCHMQFPFIPLLILQDYLVYPPNKLYQWCVPTRETRSLNHSLHLLIEINIQAATSSAMYNKMYLRLSLSNTRPIIHHAQLIRSAVSFLAAAATTRWHAARVIYISSHILWGGRGGVEKKERQRGSSSE